MRIKHILVNWALDDEELLEPYEWEDEDDLELLINAKLIHVHHDMMNDLFYGLLRFENISAGDYLFSDGNLSLALRIDDQGQLIYRSVLPFEYREAIAKMAVMLPEKILNYDLIARAEPKEYGLTRLQREKKQWILEHVEMLDNQELHNLYDLVLPLDKDINKEKLLERIEQGYHTLHEYLYECFVTQKRLS